MTKDYYVLLGVAEGATLEQIKSAIREAGYVPRQRNVFYQYLDPDPLAA